MLSKDLVQLATIKEKRRFGSPAVTPQALAWDGRALWMSSRDLGTLYKIDIEKWKVVDEVDPPGIVWEAVAGKGMMAFTIGKGLNDDRLDIHSYLKNEFTKLFV